MEFAKKMVAEEKLWSQLYVDIVQEEFDKFMILKNIDDDISPCLSVDILWHQLLLDTKYYTEYCMDKFGKIIHHYPQNALPVNKRDTFRDERTKRCLDLYRQTFNCAPPNMWIELSGLSTNRVVTPSNKTTRHTKNVKRTTTRRKITRKC